MDLFTVPIKARNWQNRYLPCERSNVYLIFLGLLMIACALLGVRYLGEYVDIGAFVMGCSVAGATSMCTGLGLCYRKKVFKHHFQEIEALQSAKIAEIEKLQSAKIVEIEKLRRKRWFHSLARPPWQDNAPEVEIEVKFVFPFLEFLGYRTDEMQLQVAVPLQEGSQPTVLKTDWVLRDANRNALVVVEAKAPCKTLDEAAREQARSYAFRLAAPVYILTNGKQIQIFHLGVVEDRCLISCSTSQLAENWVGIQRAASRTSVLDLRQQLGR